MNNQDLVHNSCLVESIYGYWPSFHDAELLTIQFSRSLDDKERKALALVELNYWETKAINEGTSALDYILDKNNIITLEFSGLSESSMNDFNFQNNNQDTHPKSRPSQSSSHRLSFEQQ